MKAMSEADKVMLKGGKDEKSGEELLFSCSAGLTDKEIAEILESRRKVNIELPDVMPWITIRMIDCKIVPFIGVKLNF